MKQLLFPYLTLASSLLALHRHGALAENMNGPHYRIANSDSFDADYSNDREFFDVYSKPIRSLYSQVHWTGHGDIPLPVEIVQRFANGKAMAVTGYEVDQVMQKNSVGDEEVSVPITWAYNHHYMAYLLNSKTSQMIETQATESSMELMGMNHGSPTQWTAHVLDEDAHDLPQAHFFSEGNGGEMRMSYHGYPKGYAQVLQSPDTFHVVPMQIDTWNRGMTNATFLPGPMPKSSKIPSSAGYNGLLECPCSDRLLKEWHMVYQMDGGDKECAGPIHNVSECILAAAQVISSTNYTTQTVEDETLPTGCSASLEEDGSLQVIWNTATQPDEKPEINKTERVVGVALSALVNITLSLETTETTDAVEIILTGPADSWFGVGFDTDSMCIHMESDECPSGGPYAIVVYDDRVEERKLGFHGPGTVLSDSIEVTWNKVQHGTRTVHLTRKLKGDTGDHFTFDPSQTDMDIILATGCSIEFAQHCGHGVGHLNFLAVNTPTKLCQAGTQGSIGGNPFKKECAAYPRSDMLEQKNPTCWVQTYQGGLRCCRHDHYLLDQDQDIPWPDQPLEYRLKFRFYFEEYQDATAIKPASHKNLKRFYLVTEAFSGEYDVPQCPKGTPTSQCIHTITSRSKVRDLVDGSNHNEAGIQLVYAGAHCHAPSCVSMELYNADTGRLICRMAPIYGESHDVFDEKGFAALPPCLWGNPADGLQEPFLIPLNTTLLSIKRNNNTLPHVGEMALWQMRGVVVPKAQANDDYIVRQSLRSAANLETGH
jgi:hypothetical protein